MVRLCLSPCRTVNATQPVHGNEPCQGQGRGELFLSAQCSLSMHVSLLAGIHLAACNTTTCKANTCLSLPNNMFSSYDACNHLWMISSSQLFRMIPITMLPQTCRVHARKLYQSQSACSYKSPLQTRAVNGPRFTKQKRNIKKIIKKKYFLSRCKATDADSDPGSDYAVSSPRHNI